MARHLLIKGEIMAETKVKSKKESKPKWALNQDDYIDVLDVVLLVNVILGRHE